MIFSVHSEVGAIPIMKNWEWRGNHSSFFASKEDAPSCHFMTLEASFFIR